LQRQHLDLAVIALQCRFHLVLKTHYDQQRLRIIAPTGVRKSFDQPQQRFRRIVIAVLFLQRIAIPVKCGVEIFVFGIAGDEVVEFVGGSLPVLRFDKVTAFTEDLHGRRVAFVLHETVQLGDVLIVTVGALHADRSDGEKGDN